MYYTLFIIRKISKSDYGSYIFEVHGRLNRFRTNVTLRLLRDKKITPKSSP